MQKKLIALAIAGLSSAAFAQSNVTIYGVMDASFESVSATGATAANSDYGSRARVTSNSSYIGFKGSEGLGNGLAVAWQIENGLYADNAGTSAWNNRDTYIGLAGGFGTVAMGNVTGPTRALGAKFDVNDGATGIGANSGLLGKGALFGSGASAFDQRITNAIAYISPNLSGFSGVLGYSTGLSSAFNAINGTVPSGRESSAAGSVRGNTAWTLGLNYEGGPIYVGYAYTVVNTTNSGVAAADGLLGAFQKAKDNRAGVQYNFGQGTIGLLWDRPTYTTSGANGVDLTTNIYFIPVVFNVGSGKIFGQYGHAGTVSNTAGNNASKMFEIGYQYNLSKRTSVRALYSVISNDAAASNDFLYGVSSGGNSTATGSAAGVSAGVDPKGVAFAVRHTF